MATLSNLPEGHLVTSGDWNAHVAQINENTTGLANGNTRITTLETNQGTRGSNGTVYSEIGTLKTNQGTRGSRGALYDEVNSIRTELFGDATRTTKPMVKLRLNANAVFNYTTNTMINWQVEDFDTANMHNASEQGVLIPVAGKYLSIITINLADNEDGAGTRKPTQGSLAMKLLLNSTNPDPGGAGVITVGTTTAPFNSAGEGPIATMTSVNQLNANDVLRVSGWHNFQDGASALNMTMIPGIFGQVGTTFTCVYLGK
jgi:hypothetical protein